MFVRLEETIAEVTVEFVQLSATSTLVKWHINGAGISGAAKDEATMLTQLSSNSVDTSDNIHDLLDEYVLLVKDKDVARYMTPVETLPKSSDVRHIFNGYKEDEIDVDIFGAIWVIKDGLPTLKPVAKMTEEGLKLL